MTERETKRKQAGDAGQREGSAGHTARHGLRAARVAGAPASLLNTLFLHRLRPHRGREPGRPGGALRTAAPRWIDELGTLVDAGWGALPDDVSGRSGLTGRLILPLRLCVSGPSIRKGVMPGGARRFTIWAARLQCPGSAAVRLFMRRIFISGVAYGVTCSTIYSTAAMISASEISTRPPFFGMMPLLPE